MKKRSNASAATRRSRRSTFTLTTAGATRAAAVTIAVWRERGASCARAAGPAAPSAAESPQTRSPRMGGILSLAGPERAGKGPRSGCRGARRLALAPPPHCEPAERGDCAQRHDDSERPDAPGHQIDEVPPRLLERLGHDARAGMPHHGNRLVYADRERAQGSVRLEIAEPPLIALDLLAHSCQLLLDIQDILELSGSCGDQLDQAGLETPRVRHAGGGVGELLADVLGADIHRLELADRCEPAQPFVEAGRRDLHLESRRAELAAAGLHRRVRDVAAELTGELAQQCDRGLERVHLDARLAGADDHGRSHVGGPDRREVRRRSLPRGDGLSENPDPCGPAVCSQAQALSVSGHSIGRAVVSVRPVGALEASQTGGERGGEYRRGEDRSAHGEYPG